MLKLRYRLGKKDVADIVALLYMAAFCIRFFSTIDKLVSAAIWTVSGALVLCYCFFTEKTYRKTMLYMLVIDLLAVLSIWINKNEYVFEIGYLLAPQSFGVLLYKQRDQLRRINFYGMCIFFYLVMQSLLIWFRVHNIEIVASMLLSNLVAKNTINILMIFFLSINIMYRVHNHISINYVYFIVGLLVSYIRDSNGGILAFSIFGIGIFLCTKGGKGLSPVKFMGVIFAVFIFLYISDSFQIVLDFLLDDNSRFAIWRMYTDLARQNWVNVIFGANANTNVVLLRFMNMHNNFINWHFFYGMLPTLFFGGILVYCGYYYYKQKNWYYLVLWGVLLVRSMTDATDYCFMSIWVFMVFDVFQRRREGAKINRADKKGQGIVNTSYLSKLPVA